MDINLNPAFVIFVAISPLLIAFVKQQGFSTQVNALIALLCYAIVGCVGALFTGIPLTLENAPTLIASATVIGSAAYALVWSKIGTGADGDAPSIDERLTAATSFVKAPAASSG